MARKKIIRDPQSWDYRQCVGCNWKTTKGAKYVSQCPKCGGRALIKQQHNVEEKEKARLRKSGRRSKKSCEGQTMLFDKTKEATQET